MCSFHTLPGSVAVVFFERHKVNTWIATFGGWVGPAWKRGLAEEGEEWRTDDGEGGRRVEAMREDEKRQAERSG